MSNDVTGYGERLAKLVSERGALCAGIDPHPSLLSRWGLPVDAGGLERCARTMVEALADLVPVFKPQSAFYELHGSKGIAVLEQVLADVRGAGALSLLDVKRGDIGSTMDAYAAAYLADGAPLAADAITVSPYLGFGSLAGTIALAEQEGRGVYVLALTSNPEGRQVQHARADSGRLVAEEIVAGAAAANAGRAYGNVGLVVGATIGPTGVDLSAVHGSLLSPGIGAQGATAADLVAVFGAALPYVLPSASRELMNPGPDPALIRMKAEQMLAQMRTALPVG
ncbi:MAG TPA: orotidine-5'-phosphate decarboxylase [Microlunatus sp.]|jgi:orotidine-5'-phosphate decarboxylase|nr:orotidine-5'-phosphate decarboxylase [Microlunatus sp.]